MKLNKLQRHTAYIIALDAGKNKIRFNFCGLFHELFDLKLDADYKFTNFKKYFPELYNKKDPITDDDCAFLFRGTERRIEALQECIEETY